jgi:PIN domain nuclease of toxin-antitoxin system
MLSGVADTHALFWFATGKVDKLGASARRIFEAADRKDGSGLVYVPTVVLHEMSSLLIGRQIAMPNSFADFVHTLEKNGFFPIVDVTAEIVVRSDDFRLVNDPFDRLIIGCAALLEQPLITLDERVTDSHLVEVIWD